MSEERRKCKVTYQGQTVEGYFEDYGNVQKFDESNNSYPVSVAIVEKYDGQVITVPPSDVKFINSET